MSRGTQTWKSDGFRWQRDAQSASHIEQVLAAPGRVIKESNVKLVTRHETAQGIFYVKRYRHGSVPLRPYKFWFKQSQAAQEWRLASELTRRGIPIVDHVALGERWVAGGLRESILVTRAFAGVPLDEAPSIDGSAVVKFVEKLAAARVDHRDMHPANVLVNLSTGELRLVDLHGIHIADDAPPDLLSCDMLAQLCITTPLPVSPDILQLSRAKRKALLANRARRCLKTNRDFARRKVGALRWHVRLSASLSPEILKDPDAFLRRARVLKDGRSTTVGAADELVIKRFNFSRWLRPLKDLFRVSRARQAFRKAYHLELCGIGTARAIAAADERCGGLVRRGYVITEEIVESQDLAQVSADGRSIARKVAELIARLHEEGFTHRDLKETNILFDRSGQPQLIDLEGLEFVKNVSPASAVANLRRLAQSAALCGKLSRATAIAFLLTYCRIRHLRPSQLFPDKHR